MDREKKQNRMGLLTASLVAAPTAIGAYNVYKNYSPMSEANIATNISSTTSKIYDAVSRHTVRDVQKYSQHLDFLRANMHIMDIPDGKSIVKESLARASSSMRGDGQIKMGKLLHAIESSTTSTEMLAAFESFSKQFDSPQFNSTFRTFNRNMEGLLSSYSKTQSLDFLKTFKAEEPTIISKRIKQQSIPKYMSDFISNIKSTLGSGTTVREESRHDLGITRRRFSMNIASPLGDIDIKVPTVSDSGLMHLGPSFNASYIHRSVGIIDPATGKIVKEMSRPDFFLQEIQMNVIPGIKSGEITSTREANKRIAEIRQRVLYGLESVQGVENLRGNSKASLAIKSNRIELKVQQEEASKLRGPWSIPSYYRELTPDERTLAIEAGSGFGGTNPKAISQSILQKEDVSGLSLFPEDIEYGKKPLSRFRDLNMTESSTRFFSNQGMINQGLTKEAKALGMEIPSVPYMFVDLDKPQMAKAARNTGMKEGESLISSYLLNRLNFAEPKNIAMKEVAQNVDSAVVGDFLGWSQEGRAIFKDSNMENLKMISHTKTNGAYTKLTYDRIRSTRGSAKFFDLKTLTHGVRNKDLYAFGAGMNEGVYGVASMDYLTKSPQRLFTQITTSLQDITKRRMDKGLSTSLPARTFLNNPEDILGMMRQARKGIGGQSATLKDLVSFGMKYGDLTEQTFGQVFGALPKAMRSGHWGGTAEDLVSKVAREQNISAVETRGFLSGMRKESPRGRVLLSYKGATSAGGLGSVEPRIFDVLHQQGTAGKILEKEMYQRLQATNPGKFALSAELRKSLGSWTGDIKPPVVANRLSLGAKRQEAIFDQQLSKFLNTGGWAQTPGGKDLYVPPSSILSEEVSSTGARLPYATDLEKTYKDLIYGLNDINGQDISRIRIEAENKVQDAMTQVWKEVAPAGKGRAGTLSGRLLGSRNLLGMSPSELRTYNETLPPDFIRDLKLGQTNRAVVSMDTAREMIDELKGTLSNDEIFDMKSRLSSGKGIPAIGWRHPLIGQFSSQPLMVYAAEMPGNSIMIPEIEKTISAKIGEKTISQKIMLSPLVGYAGDFDADTYNMMFVSPGAQKAVRKQMLNANSEFSQRYVQHQVRMQLLKPGRASNINLGMSLQELMSAGVKQGGVIEDYIGKLSSQLTGIKRSVGRYSSGKESANALSLLEWLEQHPISAKHYALKDIGEGKLKTFLEHQLAPALDIVDTRPDLLRKSISDMAQGNEIGSSMLNKDIIITNAKQLSKELGTSIPSRLQKTDIDEAIKTISSSVNEARREGFLQTTYKLSGKSRVTSKNVRQLLAEDTITRVGGRVTRSIRSGLASATEDIVSSNLAARAGKSIISNYKPLALGFIASIGLASLLAEPLKTVGPGRDKVPEFTPSEMGGGNAANNLLPESITNNLSTIVGSPTHAPIFAWKQGIMRNPGAYTRSVGTEAYDPESAAMLGNSIAQAGGAQYSRITIRDSRNITNRYAKANVQY